MIPDRTDPERRLSIEEKTATAISQLERGAISEVVFRALLFGLCMREFDIDLLVRLHRPPRLLAEVVRPIVGRFVSGLP